MKKTLFKAGLAALMLFGLASQAIGYPSIYPTGTVLYKPDKAFNGYTLMNGEDNKLVLVDMNGNLVNTWAGGAVGFRTMPEGQVLGMLGNWAGGQQDSYIVQQLDFSGKKIWEFRKWEQVEAIKDQPEENGKTWISRAHHDLQRQGVPSYYTPGVKPDLSGNTLILSHTNLRDERINKDLQLLSDIFIEVDKDGKVIWKWLPNEHLDELGFGPAAFKAMQSYPPKDNPISGRHKPEGKPGAGYDWLHVNALSYVGPNKWFDAGDQRFAPDNVIFNSRDANLFAIIDKKTGKIVWRIGPDYGPETPFSKIGQIIGAHAVHMIPKGLPGEGNIMVYDNGGLGGYGEPNPMVPLTGFHNARRDYSRVLEINPVTLEVVWEYNYYKSNPKALLGHFGYNFFSPFVSYAQRLPNGNTMITEGDSRRLFEVTKDYETVWEYVSPYAPMASQPLVYRGYRMPYEWAPQAKHAAEVSVTPPANSFMQIPNDKGQMPNIGLGKPSVQITAKGGQSATPEKKKAGGGAEEPGGMHNY